ncbi:MULTISPECIES: acyl carrier protein [unclassified Aureimonas]|uniref:acyl carrier protein n=1 Tax=unclassified Aureimonas TaxID=2615206 RepID=UPI00072115FB|nr:MULTISPECIES: acyl carrier protein [unclassified Aureimonas]ALN74681.1 hypothetical protein M673_18340 [Aureimonas sp. AU20]
MSRSEEILWEVRAVVVDTLGIDQDACPPNPSTRLFGSLPELDSFGVVELAGAIERRFGIQLEDDDFTTETFDTLGNLADVIDAKRH